MNKVLKKPIFSFSHIPANPNTTSHTTNTLSILTRNKLQLQSIIATPKKTFQTKLHLPSYLHMSQEFVKHASFGFVDTFEEVQPLVNKLKPNPALSTGEDYNEYPLQKILQICLKLLENPETLKQLPALESRIIHLLRNTSPIDNTILLYISAHSLSPELQKNVIDLLDNEIKYMTLLEKEFLFYVLCKIKNKESPHQSTLNQIREKLSSTMQKTKMSISSLVRWVILVGIGNGATANMVGMYCQKALRYEGQILNVSELTTLLKCVELRTILSPYETEESLGKTSVELIEKIKAEDMEHNVDLKMVISYHNPEMRLSNDEILSSSFNLQQKIKYIHWLWKNDLIENYEIKALYQALPFKELNISFNAGLQHLDIVYYSLWIELALQESKNYDVLLDIVHQWTYIPRGLEWPLWNYIHLLIEQKVESERLNIKEAIQKILHKIISVNSTHNTEKILNQEMSRLISTESHTKFESFLKAMQLTTFEAAKWIPPFNLLPNFISFELGIIILCIEPHHKIRGSLSKDHQTTNEHNLSKLMIEKRLSYGVIEVDVESFMLKGWNERVGWIQQEVQEKRKKGQHRIQN